MDELLHSLLDFTVGDVTFAIRWEIRAKAPYSVEKYRLIWAQITKKETKQNEKKQSVLQTLKLRLLLSRQTVVLLTHQQKKCTA